MVYSESLSQLCCALCWSLALRPLSFFVCVLLSSCLISWISFLCFVVVEFRGGTPRAKCPHIRHRHNHSYTVMFLPPFNCSFPLLSPPPPPPHHHHHRPRLLLFFLLPITITITRHHLGLFFPKRYLIFVTQFYTSTSCKKKKTKKKKTNPTQPNPTPKQKGFYFESNNHRYHFTTN